MLPSTNIFFDYCAVEIRSNMKMKLNFFSLKAMMRLFIACKDL